MIEGYVEQLSARRITGWARDLTTDVPLTIEVLVNDELVGETIAGRFRQDLLDGGKGNGRHAFEYEFIAPIADYARRDYVRARIRGSGKPLRPIQDLLNRLANEAAALPPLAGFDGATLLASHPTGRGDGAWVQKLRVQGSVLAGEARLDAGRAAILITVDGQSLGEVLVTGAPGHGFSMTLPASLQDGAEHRVAIFDASTGQRIEGGTTQLIIPRVDAPELPPVPLPMNTSTEGSVEIGRPPSRVTQVVIVAIAEGATAGERVARLVDHCRPAQAVQLVLLTSTSAADVVDDPAVPVHRLQIRDVTSLVLPATDLAQRIVCDRVIVSGATVPTLLLGLLIRAANDCAMVVQGDDRAPERPITNAFLTASQLRDPAAQARFDLTDRLLASADALTITRGAPDHPSDFDGLFAALERQHRPSRGNVPLPMTAFMRRAPLPHSGQPRELVFLSGRNDSDIHGQRADMIGKHLLASGRVRRIFHFDAPLSAAELDAQASAPEGATSHLGSLVYASTVRRVLDLADSPNVIRRTFLHRSGKREERVMGRYLPPREGFVDFVQNTLAECNAEPGPLLWVATPGFGDASIRDALDPSLVIVDVPRDDANIDLPGSDAVEPQRLLERYGALLAEADVVFCADDELRAAIPPTAALVATVGDGVDLSDWPPPPHDGQELVGLGRPIVGVFSDIVDPDDIASIGTIAEAVPGGTLLLVGTPAGQALFGHLPNVRSLGIRAYSERRRLARGLDVAIVPAGDLQNTVACLVANVQVVVFQADALGDLAAFVRVADGGTEVANVIKDALAGQHSRIDRDALYAALAQRSWSTQVAEMWRLIELPA